MCWHIRDVGPDAGRLKWNETMKHPLLARAVICISLIGMAAFFAYAGLVIAWEDAHPDSVALGAMTAFFAIIPAGLAACVAFAKGAE
jgi:hypothetical protein